MGAHSLVAGGTGFSVIAVTDDFAQTGGSTRAPAILVVEDEILIRVVIVECLQDNGFKVLEAGNAAEALTILQSGVPIGFVFSDVRMPGEMDGLGLTAWIHTHHPEIPVAVTSGDTSKIEVARLCPSDRFFAKPYDLDAVSALIRATVHHNES